MNIYQEFIREIEQELRKSINTSGCQFLCVLASRISCRNPEKYRDSQKRFQEEIVLFTNRKPEHSTINRHLLYTTGVEALIFDWNIEEFRLLVLHRMYADANYDYWTGE